MSRRAWSTPDDEQPAPVQYVAPVDFRSLLERKALEHKRQRENASLARRLAAIYTRDSLMNGVETVLPDSYFVNGKPPTPPQRKAHRIDHVNRRYVSKRARHGKATSATTTSKDGFSGASYSRGRGRKRKGFPAVMSSAQGYFAHNKATWYPESDASPPTDRHPPHGSPADSSKWDRLHRGLSSARRERPATAPHRRRSTATRAGRGTRDCMVDAASFYTPRGRHRPASHNRKVRYYQKRLGTSYAEQQAGMGLQAEEPADVSPGLYSDVEESKVDGGVSGTPYIRELHAADGGTASAGLRGKRHSHDDKTTPRTRVRQAKRAVRCFKQRSLSHTLRPYVGGKQSAQVPKRIKAQLRYLPADPYGGPARVDWGAVVPSPEELAGPAVRSHFAELYPQLEMHGRLLTGGEIAQLEQHGFSEYVPEDEGELVEDGCGRADGPSGGSVAGAGETSHQGNKTALSQGRLKLTAAGDRSRSSRPGYGSPVGLLLGNRSPGSSPAIASNPQRLRSHASGGSSTSTPGARRQQHSGEAGGNNGSRETRRSGADNRTDSVGHCVNCCCGEQGPMGHDEGSSPTTAGRHSRQLVCHRFSDSQQRPNARQRHPHHRPNTDHKPRSHRAVSRAQRSSGSHSQLPIAPDGGRRHRSHRNRHRHGSGGRRTSPHEGCGGRHRPSRGRRRVGCTVEHGFSDGSSESSDGTGDCDRESKDNGTQGTVKRRSKRHVSQGTLQYSSRTVHDGTSSEEPHILVDGKRFALRELVGADEAARLFRAVKAGGAGARAVLAQWQAKGIMWEDDGKMGVSATQEKRSAGVELGALHASTGPYPAVAASANQTQPGTSNNTHITNIVSYDQNVGQAAKPAVQVAIGHTELDATEKEPPVPSTPANRRGSARGTPPADGSTAVDVASTTTSSRFTEANNSENRANVASTTTTTDASATVAGADGKTRRNATDDPSWPTHAAFSLGLQIPPTPEHASFHSALQAAGIETNNGGVHDDGVATGGGEGKDHAMHSSGRSGSVRPAPVSPLGGRKVHTHIAQHAQTDTLQHTQQTHPSRQPQSHVLQQVQSHAPQGMPVAYTNVASTSHGNLSTGFAHIPAGAWTGPVAPSRSTNAASHIQPHAHSIAGFSAPRSVANTVINTQAPADGSAEPGSLTGLLENTFLQQELRGLLRDYVDSTAGKSRQGAMMPVGSSTHAPTHTVPHTQTLMHPLRPGWSANRIATASGSIGTVPGSVVTVPGPPLAPAVATYAAGHVHGVRMNASQGLQPPQRIPAVSAPVLEGRYRALPAHIHPHARLPSTALLQHGRHTHTATWVAGAGGPGGSPMRSRAARPHQRLPKPPGTDTRTQEQRLSVGGEVRMPVPVRSARSRRTTVADLPVISGPAGPNNSEYKAGTSTHARTATDNNGPESAVGGQDGAEFHVVGGDVNQGLPGEESLPSRAQPAERANA